MATLMPSTHLQAFQWFHPRQLIEVWDLMTASVAKLRKSSAFRSLPLYVRVKSQRRSNAPFFNAPHRFDWIDVSRQSLVSLLLPQLYGHAILAYRRNDSIGLRQNSELFLEALTDLDRLLATGMSQSLCREVPRWRRVPDALRPILLSYSSGLINISEAFVLSREVYVFHNLCFSLGENCFWPLFFRPSLSPRLVARGS